MINVRIEMANATKMWTDELVDFAPPFNDCKRWLVVAFFVSADSLISSPEFVSFPDDLTFPEAVELPDDVSFPDAVEFPDPVEFPDAVELPDDVLFPEAVSFNAIELFPEAVSFFAIVLFPDVDEFPDATISFPAVSVSFPVSVDDSVVVEFSPSSEKVVVSSVLQNQTTNI